MPNLERKKVVASLLAKGFEEDDRPRDHRYFCLVVDGRKSPIFTKVSRGSGKKYKTLGPDLVTAMGRQAKLSTAEFVRLVECTLGHDGYVALLRERSEL